MPRRKQSLITIIVPVYNEEDSVKQLLKRLMWVVEKKIQLKRKWPTEVLIVDDGSTDNSSSVILDFTTNYSNIHLIKHRKNQGKGAAISTALKEATGQICVIQDADLEYNPFEIPKLLEPLVKGKAQVVFGSRFLDLKNYNGLWSNFLGNKILSVLSSILLQRWITDLMTCYKAFYRKLLGDVVSSSFDVEPEITAKLLMRQNVRFLELPISYNPRLKGKKIKKSHGLISLWRLIITILSIQKGNTS